LGLLSRQVEDGGRTGKKRKGEEGREKNNKKIKRKA